MYDRELLAILLAVKRWNQYLVGRPFIIRTDHHSLKFLLEQRLSTPLQHTWLAKLVGYDFTIVYKKGSENEVADALSHVTSQEVATCPISCITSDLYQQIRRTWQEDPKIQELIKQLTQDPASHPSYSWIHEQLRKKGRLMVGQNW